MEIWVQFPRTHINKAGCGGTCSWSRCWGGRDRSIPEVQWPFSLAESVSSGQKALRPYLKNTRCVSLEEWHPRLNYCLNTHPHKFEHTHAHTHTHKYICICTYNTHTPTRMHKQTHHKIYSHFCVIPSWWGLLDLRHNLLVWNYGLSSSSYSCFDSFCSLSSWGKMCLSRSGRGKKMKGIRAENLP